MDLTLVSIAFFSTFFLIYHLSVNVPDLARFLPSFIINLIICNICIAVFSIHEGIIRFSETKDIVRVAKFAFLQFAIWLVLFSLDKNRVLFAPISIPFLIFNMFAVIFLLGGMRLLVKEIYQVAQFRPSSESKSLIFGAGMMGQVTKKVLDQDPKIGSTLVGFIDDSYYKVGKKIDNLPIYSAVGSDLIDLIKDKKVSNIYIAIDRLTVERKLALTDLCAPLKTKIHVVPHAKDWNRGLFQKNQLREMNIEELLHRDEIEMPTEINAMQYSGATILVTGAAGSIGSEICRQLIKHNVKLLEFLQSNTITTA
jgi:FlaA1/EpsC-like NDP-sugar epimerase